VPCVMRAAAGTTRGVVDLVIDVLGVPGQDVGSRTMLT
jgi:hypothetical protein